MQRQGAEAGGATTADSVLEVLDDGARAFTFTMLDSGYLYLAATRLAAFRSPAGWCLAVEVFGYSPRVGVPHVEVCTFGTALRRTGGVDDFVTPEDFERHRATNPYNELWVNDLILDTDWIDDETGMHVAAGARTVMLRGKPIELPDVDVYADHGITLEDPPRVAVHELCRYLAAVARDQVLATPEERRSHVSPDAAQLLVLDEWRHPDLAGDELPSDTEAFRQLAEVLATGDPSRYHPTEPPNTHWSHWPVGGTL